MTSFLRRAVIRIVFVTCISFSCQIFTGCAHGNQAQVQWTKTLRQLGIAPTYPPREDIFVGDIYLSSYNPNSKKTQRKFEHGDLGIGIEPRWSHVDLQKILKAAYESRYEFPATPDTYSAIVASAGTPVPVAPAPAKPAAATPTAPVAPAPLTPATVIPALDQPAPSGNPVPISREPVSQSPIYAKRGEPLRLEVVEMPDFTSVVLTKAEANATFPVQAVSTGIAFASSRYKQVILKVPAAESYSVDAAQILELMMAKNSKTNIDRSYLPSAVISKGKPFWLRVITEVYYARAIDITGDNQTDLGATGGATTGSGSPISSQNVACQRADTVVNPIADNTPGGSFVVTHCGSSTITLRKVFPQPIAIGTRGFVLKVNPNGSLQEIQNSVTGSVPLKMTIPLTFPH